MEKYRFDNLWLNFEDDDIEREYRAGIIDQTLLFCRTAWILVPVLGTIFALLDSYYFGDNAPKAYMLRGVLFALVTPWIVISFSSRLHHLLVYSSGALVLFVGLFCIGLVGLGNPDVLSPYFIGLFFAFAGVFTTPGLGFRPSAIALLINLLLFEALIGIVTPVTPVIFKTYNFFLIGAVVIFMYIAYLVERMARTNHIRSLRISASHSEIRQLSGLLPICATCKKIRDDQGYYQQIESYITERSEAKFTHGICPDCAKQFYADLENTEK